VSDLESCLEEWRRVVRTKGTISIYLPCEPGIALTVFRKLVSAQKAKKLGYRGFNVYIARDHINDFVRMRTLINHIFQSDAVTYKLRPFPGFSWYLNMFSIVEITIMKD
jgi:hypothetical protein